MRVHCNFRHNFCDFLWPLYSWLAMEVSERIFRIGYFVYAKMKGSPPWPAHILEIRVRMARVRFFAWNNEW